MGSTFATTYSDLTIVGARSYSWDEFPDEKGDMVPGGAKYFVQVAKADGPLATVGEVQVDLEVFMQLEGQGFGTVITVTGEALSKGGKSFIKATSIEVTAPAA